MKKFILTQSFHWIKFVNLVPHSSYHLYVDNHFVGSVHGANEMKLKKGYFSNGKHVLTIIEQEGQLIVGQHHFTFTVKQKGIRNVRDRTFQAGDILVASDNVLQEMTGYMGHAALAISEDELIESPGGFPAIKQDSIQQFLEKHPEHAQFRPKNKEMGEKAAQNAIDYLQEYKENLNNGEQKPVFNFALSNLSDPWQYVYCSKLIWLSYYHGAGYEFENDHLWFSPEDLYTILSEDENFKTVYEQENVSFKVDT